jgi:pyruvate dehydrogenase E2 component (dihydrolipoamide acetyltransferase)
MGDFTMPSLGADMDEGTLLEWLVEPGAHVHKGDILAVVDTSKAAVEVESFSDGVVERLLVEPGTRVPVGAVLATLSPVESAQARPKKGSSRRRLAPEPHVSSPLVRREAEQHGLDLHAVTGTGRGGVITRADVERAVASREGPAPSAPSAPSPPSPPAAAPVTPAVPARPRVSPYARRLAGELGVDPDRLAGPDARPVRAADVRAAAAPDAPAPAVPTPTDRAPSSTDRREEMRRTIATVMARAKREIPHYYLTQTIDLDRALGWMRERNRGLPVAERLVPAALLLKATALAASRVPALNGFWVDDGFRPGDGVHVGVAVSLRGGGLVAPALHDADRLTVGEVMAGMRDLVARARAGRLRGAELSDPTLTVTNLGEQGVESVHGVIYPPQVALVGFGRVSERPWAVDGLLGVRPLTVATLAADHRATDGFTGGRFLAAIDERLQHPEDL